MDIIMTWKKFPYFQFVYEFINRTMKGKTGSIQF